MTVTPGPWARISWSEILLTSPENCTILSSPHCVEIGEQTRCIQRNIYQFSENRGDDWKAEKVFQFQNDHFNQFQNGISLLALPRARNCWNKLSILFNASIIRIPFQEMKYWNSTESFKCVRSKWKDFQLRMCFILNWHLTVIALQWMKCSESKLSDTNDIGFPLFHISKLFSERIQQTIRM